MGEMIGATPSPGVHRPKIGSTYYFLGGYETDITMIRHYRPDNVFGAE